MKIYWAVVARERILKGKGGRRQQRSLTIHFLSEDNDTAARDAVRFAKSKFTELVGKLILVQVGRFVPSRIPSDGSALPTHEYPFFNWVVDRNESIEEWLDREFGD